jgi:hypothetical protein
MYTPVSARGNNELRLGSLVGAYVSGNYIGRFKQAGWRDKYIAAGASAEDVGTIVADLKEWKEDVDGWHAVMQCETICWN